MWSAGIKPAEPHCTLKTIQIMREIIESPVHNADGSGAMLVIRIPSLELSNLAFESLKNTRDRLVNSLTSKSDYHPIVQLLNKFSFLESQEMDRE